MADSLCIKIALWFGAQIIDAVYQACKKSSLLCRAGNVIVLGLIRIRTKHFFGAGKHQLIRPFVSITCKDKPVVLSVEQKAPLSSSKPQS